MASALDTARQTIETAIQGTSAVAIWPNDPKDPPSTGPWIEPTILWGNGFLSTKNGRNTVAGTVNINVFVPAGGGIKAAYQLADTLRDVFNRVELSGIRFGAPSGARIVPNPDSRWVQMSLMAPFTVDEIVT